MHGALSSGEVNPAAIRRLVSRVSRVQILKAPHSRGRALLGGAYRQAVEAASEAHGRLIGAVIASRDLGPSEISRRSGLSRVTVTKALR